MVEFGCQDVVVKCMCVFLPTVRHQSWYIALPICRWATKSSRRRWGSWSRWWRAWRTATRSWQRRMRSCAVRPECKMHIHANAQHRFTVVVVCWLLSLFVLMCSNHQLAQKEKMLKEEVEEMKATLSCTEEGRARASAHSKHVVSQTRAAQGESIKMLSACKQMVVSVISAYTVVTHCSLWCTASTVQHISPAMSKHDQIINCRWLHLDYNWMTVLDIQCRYESVALTSNTDCGWKWFRQSNPKSKDCIQTLDKWENSSSQDVWVSQSRKFTAKYSFPPLLLIAFLLLFRSEKTRVSFPRLLLFKKRYLTVQRGLLSEELTVKSMTWLWGAQ